MNAYQVWCEGYAATCERGKAQRLTRKNEDTLWEGETFQAACENALLTLGWDMSYYNKETNSYWGCGFFDNETEARRNYG